MLRLGARKIGARCVVARTHSHLLISPCFSVLVGRQHAVISDGCRPNGDLISTISPSKQKGGVLQLPTEATSCRRVRNMPPSICPPPLNRSPTVTGAVGRRRFSLASRWDAWMQMRESKRHAAAAPDPPLGCLAHVHDRMQPSGEVSGRIP